MFSKFVILDGVSNQEGKPIMGVEGLKNKEILSAEHSSIWLQKWFKRGHITTNSMFGQ